MLRSFSINYSIKHIRMQLSQYWNHMYFWIKQYVKHPQTFHPSAFCNFVVYGDAVYVNKVADATMVWVKPRRLYLKTEKRDNDSAQLQYRILCRFKVYSWDPVNKSISRTIGSIPKIVLHYHLDHSRLPSKIFSTHEMNLQMWSETLFWDFLYYIFHTSVRN